MTRKNYETKPEIERKLAYNDWNKSKWGIDFCFSDFCFLLIYT